LNWSLFAKDTKEIEIRKGKEERKIKIELDPGEPIWPSSRSSPQPTYPKPEPLLSPSLSLAARWTPPVISLSPADSSSPSLETAGNYSPLQFLKPPARFDLSPHL
jgi:hypothetical protein